jgi:hypothetical protein
MREWGINIGAFSAVLALNLRCWGVGAAVNWSPFDFGGIVAVGPFHLSVEYVR